MNDFVECLNGSNPLVPDAEAYGVPGLPPFTLFTPDDYMGEDSPVVPMYYSVNGSEARRIVANSSPVFYDNDYNCVRNCDALVQYAAGLSDDNGFFGQCIAGHGDCHNDAGQIRDKVRDIVGQQGVFERDGDLQTRFVAILAVARCRTFYASSGRCGFDQMYDAAKDVAQDLRAPDADRGQTETLGRRLGDRVREVDPAKIAAVATTILVTTRLYRDATRSETEKLEAIRQLLKSCTESRVLEVVPFIGELHPCAIFPIFSPGELDAGEAARVTNTAINGGVLSDGRAITGDLSSMLLTYASRAERDPIVSGKLKAAGKPSSRPGQWYRQYDPCVSYDTNTTQCQEYPYYASVRGGPPPRSESPTGPLIKPVPGAGNGAEGTAYGAFTGVCPSVGAERRPSWSCLAWPPNRPGPTGFATPANERRRGHPHRTDPARGGHAPGEPPASSRSSNPVCPPTRSATGSPRSASHFPTMRWPYGLGTTGSIPPSRGVSGSRAPSSCPADCCSADLSRPRSTTAGCWRTTRRPTSTTGRRGGSPPSNSTTATPYT